MASRRTATPNIVVILSDDQGPWALGAAGNPEIHTPHLDSLAARGVRFENLFCASPVCSPSRASILTGLIPSQHGVHDWLREDDTAASPRPVSYLDGLTSYPEVLSAAGYHCGLSGKWHLGDSATPQAGFRHWYAHRTSHGDYFAPPMARAGQPIDEAGYVTELITEDALSFLADSLGTQQPFCLSVNYTAPHHPWVDQHPREFLDLYADCPFSSCPQEPVHPWLHPSPNQAVRDALADPRPSLIGYFAAVTAMDHGIGKLADFLHRHGLMDSTVLLFLSDNGYSCGHHGIWGKGNGTYPLNLYEESVKVPGILVQPGTVPAATVLPDLVSTYDIFPTLLDLAGVSRERDPHQPGRSWAGLLRGGGGPERGDDFTVVYDEYGSSRMIRTRRWKYVARYPDGPDELFDLHNDPGERENRVGDRAVQGTAGELRAELEEWFARYVRPSRDGTRLPVTGSGQCRPVGASGGHDAFYRGSDHVHAAET